MSRLAAACVVAACAAACAPVPVPRHGAYQASDADVAVTRIVHDSYVVSLRGTRFVVDPWFYSGLLHRQREPLGLTPATVPPAEAVVVTDGADDHFDPETLAALSERIPRAIAPAPQAERLSALGFADVRGLRPWERTTVGAATVTAVPTGGGDARLGFVFVVGAVSAYAAGDVRGSSELVDVATAFPDLDVAFLPIGGRRVLGIRRDMGPEQAAEAVATLRPTAVIPVGYGVQGSPPFVWYAGDATARLREALDARGLGGRLVVLEPGESWHRY